MFIKITSTSKGEKVYNADNIIQVNRWETNKDIFNGHEIEWAYYVNVTFKVADMSILERFAKAADRDAYFNDIVARLDTR